MSRVLSLVLLFACSVARADDDVLQRIEAAVNPVAMDFAAMPEIVRLSASPQLQVRDAARRAVKRFGRNAIWQLREFYKETTGRDADKAWSSERAAAELYAVLDRTRNETGSERLTRGREALARRDWAALEREYDLLLAEYPHFPGREQLAPGYAALGAESMARREWAGAHAAYLRATWLDPASSELRQWRARVTYAEAELSRAQGVVDLNAYARALRFDPQLEAARRTRERLLEDPLARVQHHKRLAALGALVLILGMLLVFLRASRKPAVQAAD